MIELVNNELRLNDNTFYDLKKISKKRVLQGLSRQVNEGSLTKNEYEQCVKLINKSEIIQTKRKEALEFLKERRDYAKDSVGWSLEVTEKDYDVYDYLIKCLEDFKEENTSMDINTLIFKERDLLKKDIINRILETQPNATARFTINLLKEIISNIEENALDKKIK